MKRQAIIKVVWLIAGISVSAGLILAVYATMAMNAAAARMADTSKLVEQLRTDLLKTSRVSLGRELYSKLPPGKPAELAECLKNVVGAPQMDDSKDLRQEIGQGWSVRQKEISFSEIPVGAVMDFVTKAEALRPPWTMVKCQIRSSTTTAGAGQITVVMETVERKN